MSDRVEMFEFLEHHHRKNEEVMLMPELDGFLAGIVICPEEIPPERWVPYIWSKVGALDKEPEFSGSLHRKRIIAGIYDCFAETSMCLRQSFFIPHFGSATDSTALPWSRWMRGFETALPLAPEAWKLIEKRRNTKARKALFALRSLAEISRQDPSERSSPPMTELEASETIIESVGILYEWRRTHM